MRGPPANLDAFLLQFLTFWQLENDKTLTKMTFLSIFFV